MNIKGCKILIIPYTHTLSHLSRPLEIAKHLSSSGCRISFAGSSSKTEFIKDEGFQVFPIYEPDPDILFNNIRNKKIKFIDDDTLYKMIESDLQIFKAFNPDLVLTDGRFSAMISTQMADVRHAAIVNGSSTPYRAVPYFPVFAVPGADKYPPDKILYRMLNPINIKFEIFVFDNIMKIFKSISRQNRLMHEVTATNCLCGVDLTLIADIHSFFPTKNLPSTYHYIGPVTWKAPKLKKNPEWWPIEKHGKKLAYVTMGTTGEANLFQKVYDVLRHIDNMISVITTGNQFSDIQVIPGKIYVTDYMDGDTIMKKADFVICHGGNGTIYQALSCGKPVIGIPTIPDQDFNMRMVENLKAGSRLSMNKILSDPVHLKKAIKYITESGREIRKPLMELKTRFNHMNGAASGAKLICEFIENRL